ncbi:hypothetical protein SUREIYA_00500 [Serratia phage vB_SmaM-Sureiya]|nr:hypothetical protein SUREIYA_00500 [Serratia phage vB_SmaM-Sureiya]
MQLTMISKSRLKDICENVCRRKRTIGKCVSTGIPQGDAVALALKEITHDLFQVNMRVDHGDKPGFVDCKWSPKGMDRHICVKATFIDSRSPDYKLLEVWVDSDGHAHIEAYEGSYAAILKVVVPSELEEWISNFLRVL